MEKKIDRREFLKVTAATGAIRPEDHACTIGGVSKKVIKAELG